MEEPGHAEAVSSLLAEASRARRRVAIHGGGTKQDWGGVPGAADVHLSTRRLNAIVAHRYGDLTATVEAGAVLENVNRELARHGQWIPLDPAWSDRATIGGIVATNDAGPRRHRYGAPRDLIIGADVARADGTLAKAGGIVVKNVAGYDVARLMTGSFGCLGVILRATFKLYPLSPASRTVIADVADAGALGRMVAALIGSQLTPTAVEVAAPPLRLLIRFESTDASVAAQSAGVQRLIEGEGGRCAIVTAADEQREWAAHQDIVWRDGASVAKVVVLPSALAETLAWFDAQSGIGYRLIGRAALSVLFVALDGPADAQARWVNALRSRIPAGRGSVVLLRGSTDLKAAIDPWGPIGSSLPLMQSIKRSFDPNGILNPGRGPGGM